MRVSARAPDGTNEVFLICHSRVPVRQHFQQGFHRSNIGTGEIATIQTAFHALFPCAVSDLTQRAIAKNTVRFAAMAFQLHAQFIAQTAGQGVLDTGLVCLYDGACPAIQPAVCVVIKITH